MRDLREGEFAQLRGRIAEERADPLIDAQDRAVERDVQDTRGCLLEGLAIPVSRARSRTAGRPSAGQPHPVRSAGMESSRPRRRSEDVRPASSVNKRSSCTAASDANGSRAAFMPRSLGFSAGWVKYADHGFGAGRGPGSPDGRDGAAAGLLRGFYSSASVSIAAAARSLRPRDRTARRFPPRCGSGRRRRARKSCRWARGRQIAGIVAGTTYDFHGREPERRRSLAYRRHDRGIEPDSRRLPHAADPALKPVALERRLDDGVNLSRSSR